MIAEADEPISVESILRDTRPDDPSDYRTWGRSAGIRLAEYPELAETELIRSMTGRARQTVTREQSRTADGVARFIADTEQGQVTAWPTWIDPVKVRVTGERLQSEGQRKVATGQRMQQAADCMDAHQGMTAREAWIAEGFDPSALDEAEEAAS